MFIPRIVKPIENESLIVNDCYFNATNNGYYPNYQMPNCTCYALGRALEIAKQNNIVLDISGLGLNSASSWGKTGVIGSNWQKGTIPKLGAIAVYENGTEDGHVCVVEELKDDGGYLTSNSAWYRPIDTTNWHYFYTSNHDKYNNSDMLGSSYSFKYFLYPPYVDNMNPQPTPQEERKKSFNWILLKKRRFY